eukprot:15284167-Heterocapsa_arctica.AAC.1
MSALVATSSACLPAVSSANLLEVWTSLYPSPGGSCGPRSRLIGDSVPLESGSACFLWFLIGMACAPGPSRTWSST